MYTGIDCKRLVPTSDPTASACRTLHASRFGVFYESPVSTCSALLLGIGFDPDLCSKNTSGTLTFVILGQTKPSAVSFDAERTLHVVQLYE